MPANKIFLYCYYIAFKTKDGCGWRIRETIHNLETSDGLMKIILELEKQEGKDIIITYYKRLNYSFWRWLYEKILCAIK